jgi:hypothetical protein
MKCFSTGAILSAVRRGGFRGIIGLKKFGDFWLSSFFAVLLIGSSSGQMDNHSQITSRFLATLRLPVKLKLRSLVKFEAR